MIKRVDGLDGFKVTTSTYLCHEHFQDCDIKKNIQRWKLQNGAVPSPKLHAGDQNLSSMKAARKAPTGRSSSSLTFEPSPEPLDAVPSSVSTQTDMSYVEKAIFGNCFDDHSIAADHKYSQGQHCILEVIEFTDLLKKVEQLSTKINELEKEMSYARNAFFSVEKLQNDDEAVKFYTGFPSYESFSAVFEYFQPKLQHISYWRGIKSTNASSNKCENDSTTAKRGPKRKLSHLDEFLFVVMRLKGGLFLGDLADRFGISVGHASKIFTTWINFLFHELPLLFPYPSKDLVQRLLPDEFKNYPSTRIIIDCTELFIEVPSSLKSQSQTWSDYKHLLEYLQMVPLPLCRSCGLAVFLINNLHYLQVFFLYWNQVTM